MSRLSSHGSGLRLAICGLCLLLAPGTARAGEWHFTPSFGVTFAGSTTLYDAQLGTDKKHVNFGGMVSRFGDGIIGVEGIFLYTRHFFEFDGPRDPANPPLPTIVKSYSLSMTGNVVLTVPKRWTEYFLRPYVSGGFGMMRAVATDQAPGSKVSVTPISANMPAFSIGGGAIGFFSQGTGIRFDMRYHNGVRRNFDPSQLSPLATTPDLHLHYMTAEIGVVIRR